MNNGKLNESNLDGYYKEAHAQAIGASADQSFLEEIVKGFVHEVSDPLSVIQGKALQLSRKLEKNVFDQSFFQQELAKIAAMSSRVFKIINGLRAFSQSDYAEPMERVDVNDIINDTLALYSDKFRNPSVKLNVKCHLKVSILCRQIQISQILINLLGNAFDAVEHLEDKWVSLEVTQKNGLVSISVTDSGNGISQEIADKMARPFFSTKEPGKGMGLGLSLSRRIAEEHKASLKYDATSSNTRFVLEMPIA